MKKIFKKKKFKRKKKWLCQTDLIISLVNKFHPSLDEEVIENASQALVDIIAVSIRTPNSPLILQLESEPMISKLFDFILSKVFFLKKKSILKLLQKGLTPSLLHGLTVLVELLQRNVQENVDSTSTIDSLPPFLKLVSERVDKLFVLLKSDETSNKKVTLTFGEIVPLGFHRLKVIEFFCALRNKFVNV